MTQEEVQKIARLARLELTSEELGKYAKQLSNILEFVNTLQELDTKDVEITAQVTGLTNVFREDVVVEPGSSHDDLLSQVPELENGGVKVKSVF